VFRISDGRPNVMDMIEEKRVAWVVNTPSTGAQSSTDEVKMRARAVIRGVPITTTMDGLRAATNAIESLRKMKSMEVCSLQEFHRHAPKLKLKKGKIRGKNLSERTRR
jgi:carbamoyl-phosphate synthase large subunit